MTILPKKKAAKDKSESETTEHSHSSTVGHPHPHGHNHAHGHSLSHPHTHGHYHHTSATETRHEKATRGRTSPTRWGPSTSREEKLPPRTHTNNSAFEFDFEGHDSASNHKRRHRSSPHRTVRKHRGHSTNGQGSPGTSSSYDCDDAYNSEDEHIAPAKVAMAENKEELERRFEQALKEKRGFVIKKMGEDGACLFRAVADQVFGDQEMNSDVRNMCIDYMAKNAEFFSQYVTEDFKTYLNRKRMDSCHGNHLEIQAIAELFNRPVEVYQYSIEPINTFHSHYKTDYEPIRISYHGGVHYNSVVDPYKATIGVGLGLPGYQPGLADKNLMRDALKNSEDYHIEKTMLEDKLRETDWELTQESIEEQVARESYFQWVREQEAASRQQGPARSASATCSSASEYARLVENSNGSPEARSSRSPRTRSGQNSPQHATVVDLAIPGSSKSPWCSPKQTSDVPPVVPENHVEEGAIGGFRETSSLMDHLPPAMFDWEEDDILAQVMAVSHQEYLDSLKRQASSTESSPSSTAALSPLACTTDPGLDQACCSTSVETSHVSSES